MHEMSFIRTKLQQRVISLKDRLKLPLLFQVRKNPQLMQLKNSWNESTFLLIFFFDL